MPLSPSAASSTHLTPNACRHGCTHMSQAPDAHASAATPAQASVSALASASVTTPRIAVIVPCYNEAVTIAKVIEDFRRALPLAAIYVFDNNSRDNTCGIAFAHGAQVRTVTLQGKGHVVRRQFADVDADISVMLDGDDTYHAASAGRLVQHLRDGGFDMVVAVRAATNQGAYRGGHARGNRLLTGFLAWLFGRPCKDILSGYRVF